MMLSSDNSDLVYLEMITRSLAIVKSLLSVENTPQLRQHQTTFYRSTELNTAQKVSYPGHCEHLLLLIMEQ